MSEAEELQKRATAALEDIQGVLRKSFGSAIDTGAPVVVRNSDDIPPHAMVLAVRLLRHEASRIRLEYTRSGSTNELPIKTAGWLEQVADFLEEGNGTR